MIAHQDHVLEAGGDALLRDAFQDDAENLRRQADRARQIGARIVRRIGQDRHEDRVAQLQRDRLDDLVRHQRVAAVDVLRSALLGAAGVHERGRLAGGERGFDFRPGHHAELDERLLGAGCRRRPGCLGERRAGQKSERQNRAVDALHTQLL